MSIKNHTIVLDDNGSILETYQTTITSKTSNDSTITFETIVVLVIKKLDTKKRIFK